jgi:L-amino acid N-acyltransferase
MIRSATPDDLASITHIYNEAIAEGGYTGDLEPLSVEQRTAWYLEHRGRYVVFVKTVDAVVVGYAALSPYRKGRQAFNETCEISYYLSKQFRGCGFGKELILHSMEYAKRVDFTVIVAIVLGCNRRSIDLLLKLGFSISGTLPKVAKIGAQYIDHVYLSQGSPSADEATA